MRLFGGILPFIGYRKSWVDRATAAEWGITDAPYNMKTDEVQIEALEVEWLNLGFTFWGRGAQQ